MTRTVGRRRLGIESCVLRRGPKMTGPVPIVRPFRALRYDAAALGDLSAVICPPYDVITPAERERLLARDPRNAVRVELPVAAPPPPPPWARGGRPPAGGGGPRPRPGGRSVASSPCCDWSRSGPGSGPMS